MNEQTQLMTVNMFYMFFQFNELKEDSFSTFDTNVYKS